MTASAIGIITFTLDLRAYAAPDFTIAQIPRLYVYPHDVEDHALCEKRKKGPPRPYLSPQVDPRVWTWELPELRGGVIDLVWDLARVVTLLPGQVALFGYGSLLSRPSMERTLGRSYQGPFLPCRLRGWRRTWDAAVPNSRFFTRTADSKLIPQSILYLNVRPDPGTIVNGVLFVLEARDLAEFDRRESVYNRIDITPNLEGVRVEGGAAFVYAAKDEHRLTNPATIAEAAVRATYLAIVEDGLTAFGGGFRAGYRSSTDPVPQGLVINDLTDDPA